MVRKISPPPLKPLTCKSFFIFFFEVIWFFLIVIPSVIFTVLRKLCKVKKDLRGKVVLVTGTGNGLGKEMAVQLSKMGCTVLCVDLKADDNKKTLAQIRETKGQARAYTCDVSDKAQVGALSDRILDEYGRVDVLINNAGLIFGNSILTATPEQITKIVNVNFLSVLWMIRAFLPSMISNKGGHIVCISSLSAIHALGQANIYSCTKFAVLGLVYAMLEEFRSKNLDKAIKISCALPYFISTSKATQWKMRFPPLSTEKAAALIIEGVRKELKFYTVPWTVFGYAITTFLRILPTNIYNRFRDRCYAEFLGDTLPDNVAPPPPPQV